MYRDSPSWDERLHHEEPRRHAGQAAGTGPAACAYLTCSKKAVELAKRPQNLPAVKKLSGRRRLLHRHDLRRRPLRVLRPRTSADAPRRHALEAGAFRLRPRACSASSAASAGASGPFRTPISSRASRASAAATTTTQARSRASAPCPCRSSRWSTATASPCMASTATTSTRRPSTCCGTVTSGARSTTTACRRTSIWKQPAAEAGPLDLVPRWRSFKARGAAQVRDQYRWAVEKRPPSDWTVFVHFTDARR